jgi:hypothetical protein
MLSFSSSLSSFAMASRSHGLTVFFAKLDPKSIVFAKTAIVAIYVLDAGGMFSREGAAPLRIELDVELGG